MKRNLFVLFSHGLPAILAGALIGRLGLAQQGRANVAFTATRIEKAYAYPGGELRSESEFTIARQPDGSNVLLRLAPRPGGSSAAVKSVVDLRTRTRIAVDGITRSLTTYIIAEKVAAGMAGAAACEITPSSPQDVYLGFEIHKTTEDLPGQSGEINRIEKWLAPSLNCLPMKETFWKGDGTANPVVVSEKRVTSVTIGEPDAGLFTVPDGYTERSPSAVLSEKARLDGRKIAECAQCAETGAVLDEAYYARQKR